MFWFRAWSAWGFRQSAACAKRSGANESNFEESVQEGDVVCPFLQRSLEQGEGSVDARSIFAVGFVLSRRVVLWSEAR